MEMIYSRELGLAVTGGNHEPKRSALTLADTLLLYQRLKETNRINLFFDAYDRSLRYPIDCLGHENLDEITSKDAGRFRDYLFDRCMSSSSIKRIFSTVRAVITCRFRKTALIVQMYFLGLIFQMTLGQLNEHLFLLINHIKFKRSVWNWMTRPVG